MDLMRTLLSSLLFLCGMAELSIGEPQLGNAKIAVQPGECRAELNGVDIGCPAGAVHTRLENGRHIVNFPANDLAGIGFAGQKIDVTGNLSSILWIDATYINQQRFDADGQCSFERSSPGDIKLECKALQRDGRKLSASLQNADQKGSFLGVDTASASREKCERMIKMHGMLSRAQFQCKFANYNTALIDETKKCLPIVGNDLLERLLRKGMMLFDSHEKERGHKATCSAILADFPNFVRK